MKPPPFALRSAAACGLALLLVSAAATGAQQTPAGAGAQPAPAGAGAQQTPAGAGAKQAPTGAAAQEAPTIRVVGADPQAGVKVATSTATSSFRLPLELDRGAVKELTATVDQFVAPNATRIEPTLTLNGKPANQAITVTQTDRPILEVSATFPVVGDYKSQIVLTHSGGRLPSVPLTVTRQRSDVTAEIAGLETVTTTKWRTADARIRFTVRETAGQKLALYPPALDGFALKESDKVRRAAHYAAVDVDGAGAPKDQPPAATESFVVEPHRGRPVVVDVRGIQDAGEYSGTIRLASSNGTPVTKEVTVLVKTSGWVAAFWVFLGVVASFLIRRYTKEQRPRLQALRRVRYAEDDLAAVEREAASPTPPAPPAASIFEGIRQRLARIERSLNDGTARDGASASLDEVDKKIVALPGWLSTGRWLDAVQPADIVEAPRAAWRALASSYFLKAGATDDITAALTKIEADLKGAVVARIKEFTDQVTAYKSAHPGAAAEIDQNVAPRLARAKAGAETGDWAGMTVAFREARLAYAKVLASEFDAILTAPAPLGFDAVTWPALGRRVATLLERIRQESDPDRAVALHREANQTYLGEVLAKLDAVVDGLVKTGSAAEAKELEGATTALTAARLAGQKADWVAGRAAYEKAAKIVTAVLDARKKAGGGAQAGAVSQPAASFWETVPPGAAMGTATPLSALSPRTKTTADQLSDWLERYDLLLNLALLLIACVVGVSLLWANDAVWGGWKAYTTALLWGLGLHQVGGSVLEGLPAVTKKLTE
jgi:hypothetical protein